MELKLKMDSRLVKKGDTFIAIPGISSNGQDYIARAIENGASHIITEVPGSYGVETTVVPDTRAYLTAYLKEHYGTYLQKMKLVGITGTNGKTTSAYLLYELVRMIGKKAAYLGTLGFFIDQKIASIPNTTPDILEVYNMLLTCYEMGCEYVFMEVSSQGICYGRVAGLEFDAAIFTNLTQDHLDYHKTMENYALAKQRLFLQLKKDGKAFINADDPYRELFLLKENQNITYGFTKADYQVTRYKMSNQGTTFTYLHQGKEENIYTKLLGKYNVSNLLVVISVLTEFGIEEAMIQKQISIIKAPKGRMETISYLSNSIIIDYAHTPDAIEKIILTMKEVTEGNIYVVFGCTGDRDRTKRPIMTELVTSLCKKAILTNDDPHNEDPKQIFEDMTRGIANHNYEVCMDRRKAIQKGMDLLKEQDTLLILGKGHEEVMIIRDQRIPFQDSEVVLTYLETLKSGVHEV